MKPIACLLQRTPYGHSKARESLEAVQALAALEHPIFLCCIGDGVWQLVKHQHHSPEGLKAYTEAFHALSLYDISTLYVAEKDLKERGLSPAYLMMEVELLSPSELAHHIEACAFTWML